MNFSAFFSGIFVWFLPVIFVGLTTDAWAGDFQIRLKFPKEKAAILISPDGLCSWEKQFEASRGYCELSRVEGIVKSPQ